jgi:hypothetical protein
MRVALERTAILVGMLLAIACGPVIPRVDSTVPGPSVERDEETLLLSELDALRLGDTIVDSGALCGSTGAPLSDEPRCFAPVELSLDEPGLRDARREPSVSYLWSPERYSRVIGILEHALVRSRPHTVARRKILGWLATTYDRWRATLHAWKEPSKAERPIPASPCLTHYLRLLVGEARSERERELGRYTLAIELERAGKLGEARALYERLSRSRRRTPAVSLARAALGDVAFRHSFCDPSFFRIAHREYLAAAHGPSPARFRVPAYARLRLGQLEREAGALGTSARQLDLAEAEGIYPGAGDLGPRSGRLRGLLERALVDLVRPAVADGTLRLLTSFEPPSTSFCIALSRIRPRNEQIAIALYGPCREDFRDEDKSCAQTPGCTKR